MVALRWVNFREDFAPVCCFTRISPEPKTAIGKGADPDSNYYSALIKLYLSSFTMGTWFLTHLRLAKIRDFTPKNPF